MSRSRRRESRGRAVRPRHRREDPRETFRCCNCRRTASAVALGSRHRNHCPACLWSLHLDDAPGDRRSECSGRMEPICIWVRPDGEWSLVHRCAGCGVLKSNRIAGDDNEFVLMSLASRPIALPPFPLEPLARGSDGDD